jgi:hypothetical protein
LGYNIDEIYFNFSKNKYFIYLGVYFSRLEITKILIDNQADLNTQDSNDVSSLMLETYIGDVDMLKTLINNNANLDLINQKTGGLTALMFGL